MKEDNKQPGQKKHKDIARIDQESKRSHGWYVRVNFQGKTYSKLFSDKKHGSRDSALMGAIAWRDSTEKRIGKIRTDKHIVTTYRGKSGTGVVGVRLNEEYNRYEVSWVSAEGKQGKTSISIRKHGKEAAFIKACIIRQEKEQERHRVDTSPHKVTPAVRVKKEKYIVTAATSSTGVVGVLLNERKNRYEISWYTAEGKQRRTSLSIRKYGQEEAFVRACNLRLEKEKERQRVEDQEQL